MAGETLDRLTVRGNQGLWQVCVPGYGDVGIVADWWKPGSPDQCPDTHHDPNLSPLHPQQTKARRLCELIKRTGLVVTADIRPREELPDGSWMDAKRGEYFFLWRVEDVTFDQEGLKFRFVERLADVGKKNKWQEPRKLTRRGTGSY
jgi:hypothetical protein